MKHLQIDEQTAKGLYKTAAPEFKVMLEQSFGKAFFSGSVMGRVKTVKDAYVELGIDYDKALHEMAGLPTDEQAYRKLKIVVKALNGGWKPDWKNSGEYKYYPWFDISGPGLACNDFDDFYSASFVGSRLCFKSSELAKYAGKQFIDLYKDFMLIKPQNP